MREKSVFFLVLVILAIIISGSFVFLEMQDDFIQVAKFKDSSIIAPETDENGAAVLSEGHSAIITVDVEKLQDIKIDEITIVTSLTNSINGKFLLIDKKTIQTDFEKYSKLGSEQIDREFEQMGVGATIGPTPIMVTNIDSRIEKFEDTLNVILYANDVEMDRLSYDIVTKSGIP